VGNLLEFMLMFMMGKFIIRWEIVMLRRYKEKAIFALNLCINKSVIEFRRSALV
jgi:hypothetical protein